MNTNIPTNLRVKLLLAFCFVFLIASTVFCQEIEIITPVEDTLCTETNYTYVAELKGATHFEWDVYNTNYGNSSNVVEYYTLGSLMDTLIVKCYIPSFFEDIISNNLISVQAYKNDTLVTSKTIDAGIFVLPFVRIVSQNENPYFGDIACGDMSHVLLNSFNTSTNQKTRAFVYPEDAGTVLSNNFFYPLSQPYNLIKILWNPDFKGLAEIYITAFNNCDTITEIYQLIKSKSDSHKNVDVKITGSINPCSTRSRYSIKSNSIAQVAYSLLPRNAYSSHLHFDSLYIENGVELNATNIDVYWENSFSGIASLIIHEPLQCDGDSLNNSFINIDTIFIHVCSKDTATYIDQSIYIDKINITPNPVLSGNYINIDIESSNISMIELFDINGNRVLNIPFHSNQKYFKIPDELPSGVYYLKGYLENSPNNFIKKIFIL